MTTTILELLNQAMHRSLSANQQVYLLGEDVLDPYGGAFKVSRGLSSAFPKQVYTTPISEAGIVGIAIGMALRGLRPVVEIMFGDFITLAADQLINHAAKFRWMYNEQVRVPLVVRTPMGGRRGYGPTHSQTLEKLFLGVPGLEVLAPAPFDVAGEHAGSLLERAILKGENPTLFVENKLLYLLPMQGSSDEIAIDLAGAEGESPTYRLKIVGAPPPDLTIAAYGYMAELARQAARQLAYDHEIFCEVIVPTRLSPFNLDAILASTHQSKRLLVIEEGTLSLGWGAEVLARAAEQPGLPLHRAGRLGALDLPIPASGPLEKLVLPGVREIVARARQLSA